MPNADVDPNDAMIRMWYVSVSFEVVCVTVQADGDAPPRQRPLLAVDFGHAAWLEHDENPFRFVSFPGVKLEDEGHTVRGGTGGGGPDGLDGGRDADTGDTARAGPARS